MVESHLETASKLKQLITVEFLCPGHGEQNSLRSVRIRQQDFPSVKTFKWAIPIALQFQPEDRFSHLYVETFLSIKFSDEKEKLEFIFNLSTNISSWSVHLVRGQMTRLKNLQLFKTNKYHYGADKFHLSLMKLIKSLTQVETVHLELMNGRSNTHDVVKWIASLTALKKIEGFLDQIRLTKF